MAKSVQVARSEGRHLEYHMAKSKNASDLVAPATWKSLASSANPALRTGPSSSQWTGRVRPMDCSSGLVLRWFGRGTESQRDENTQHDPSFWESNSTHDRDSGLSGDRGSGPGGVAEVNTGAYRSGRVLRRPTCGLRSGERYFKEGI